MRRIHSSTVGAALAAAGALAVPTTAAATPTCTYDATTATVTLALDAPAANGAYTLARNIDRIGWLDGRPRPGVAFTACTGATVANTDTIEVTGTADADDLVIDLANRFPLSPGGFAPGRTAEADGKSEIEIDVDLDAPSSLDTVEISGSPRADFVSGGDDPVSGLPELLLDDDDDVDLTLGRDRSLLVVDGNGGDDVLELAGAGIGASYTGDSTLRGGPGADVLLGGEGDDTITGGTGLDLPVGNDGQDTIDTADGLPGEHVVGGQGNDVVTMDPGDFLDG
jgi:Ca2+-binding RTX toxin-like protein